MTKKRIIAYALAITSLFGVYKGCHKLGEHIRENYLNESFSDSTLNNETTINETLSAIIPTETTIIPETTLVEETTPETTFIEETVPETTSNFIPVFIPSYATDDLALFDDNNNVIYMVEKYEKLTVTKIFENKVECLTTDGYSGYTDFYLLEKLPETYAEVDIN